MKMEREIWWKSAETKMKFLKLNNISFEKYADSYKFLFY